MTKLDNENFLVDRFLRLRHDWTKNDGKPWEEWAPGRSLKETVLIWAAAICTALMALLVGVQIFRWF